jgi:hypothetical protein
MRRSGGERTDGVNKLTFTAIINDNPFNHFNDGILKHVAKFMAARAAWLESRFKYFFLVYYTSFY